MGSTTLGYPYPDGSGEPDGPGNVAALAAAVDASPGVSSLSGTAIGALGSALKRAGRLVYNSTTGRLQLADGATFADMATAADVAAVAGDLESLSGDVGDLATLANGTNAALPWTFDSYTPTLLAASGTPSLGTGGTAYGLLTRTGKMVDFMARFVLGTSPSLGTGQLRITLPSTAMGLTHDLAWHCSGQFSDPATDIPATITGTISGASATAVYLWRTTGAAVSGTQKPTTGVWVTGDYITISGRYMEA